MLALVGLPLLTLGLSQLRDQLGLQTVIVLYLLFVIVDAAVGGLARRSSRRSPDRCS